MMKADLALSLVLFALVVSYVAYATLAMHYGLKRDELLKTAALHGLGFNLSKRNLTQARVACVFESAVLVDARDEKNATKLVETVNNRTGVDIYFVNETELPYTGSGAKAYVLPSAAWRHVQELRGENSNFSKINVTLASLKADLKHVYLYNATSGEKVLLEVSVPEEELKASVDGIIVRRVVAEEVVLDEGMKALVPLEVTCG